MAGIVNWLGCTYNTSLYIIIIYFLIIIAISSGFSIVIILLDVYLTNDIICIYFNGYDGDTAKFILYDINSYVTGFLNHKVNFTWHAFNAYTDNL